MEAIHSSLPQKKLFKQQVEKSTGNVVSRFSKQKTKTSVYFTGDIFLLPIQLNIFIEMAYSRAEESDPEGAACFGLLEPEPQKYAAPVPASRR